MAQTFGAIVEYVGEKEGAERSTSSTQIRSAPEKVVKHWEFYEQEWHLP
jgi:hypothetical protein